MFKSQFSMDTSTGVVSYVSVGIDQWFVPGADIENIDFRSSEGSRSRLQEEHDILIRSIGGRWTALG